MLDFLILGHFAVFTSSAYLSGHCLAMYPRTVFQRSLSAGASESQLGVWMCAAR